MGHMELTKLLIENGAKWDHQTKQVEGLARQFALIPLFSLQGLTPLLVSCLGGHLTCLQFLHSKGASMEVKDTANVRDFSFGKNTGPSHG